MEKENIFIGVAWPYVNGNLHVGHVAGYLLPADITARFYRLLEHKVLMVSGSDCFGTPITVEADKRGLTPREVVNEYHQKDVELFKNLGITYDLYTKTDTDNHREITQKFLLEFWKKDLLKIDTQKQYYSESLSRFLPDRYVEGQCPNCGFSEARSDQCDNCGKLLNQDLIKPVSKIDKKPVSLRDTKHLFICWDKLQKKIEKYVSEKSTFWRAWVRGETLKWLSEGLAPRAVTRDLDWGVEIPSEIAAKLPGSENKRVYVWFDAVIGYYSASIEYSKLNDVSVDEFWYGNNTKHYYFMGKDNLVFHTIFWPGQLMTYDDKLHLPDYPMINQYLNLEGKKFSKSRNVVVDTSDFIKEFGSDALRFYLATIMPENSDSSFTWEDFYEKNNNVLVGHIGNYIHRTLSIYSNNQVTAVISKSVLEKIQLTLNESIKNLTESKFKNYVANIEELSSFANNYFNQLKPWISKTEDPEIFIKDGSDLVILTYALISLMEPITPNATKKYLDMVGLNANEMWKNVDKLEGHLKKVLEKIKLNKPSLLFPKYEPKVE